MASKIAHAPALSGMSAMESLTFGNGPSLSIAMRRWRPTIFLPAS